MGDPEEIAAPSLESSTAWRPILAVSLSATLFTALQGLTYPLLSVLLDQRGIAEGLIGLNAAMMPVGMIVAAPLAGPWMRSVGARALLLASIGGAVLMLVLIGATANFWLWLPLRLVTGACLAWVFIVTDTWVNELATPRTRGRVLGFYSMLTSLGFALGPLFLSVRGTGGWAPFLAGACCGLAALVPLSTSRDELPPRAHERGAHHATQPLAGSVRGFVRAAPLLVAGTAASALADQVAMSLLPIFCLRHGMDVRTANVALISMVAGSMCLQYPMGWLADRFSVRTLYVGCALATAASALALALTVRAPPLFWAVTFLWGGTYYAIFTLALVMLGRRFSGNSLVAGNATFAATWGVGGLIGTPLAGAAMQRFGPVGFPATLVAIFLGLALAVAIGRDPSDPKRAAGD